VADVERVTIAPLDTAAESKQTRSGVRPAVPRCAAHSGTLAFTAQTRRAATLIVRAKVGRRRRPLIGAAAEVRARITAEKSSCAVVSTDNRSRARVLRGKREAFRREPRRARPTAARTPPRVWLRPRSAVSSGAIVTARHPHGPGIELPDDPHQIHPGFALAARDRGLDGDAPRYLGSKTCAG